MGENIKQNKGTNPTFKFEITKTIPNTINFKTFLTKKHIFFEVENRKETKKNTKFLTRKLPLFFVEKKKLQTIQTLMMEDGQKKNITNFFKELSFMVFVGKKLNL